MMERSCWLYTRQKGGNRKLVHADEDLEIGQDDNDNIFLKNACI